MNVIRFCTLVVLLFGAGSIDAAAKELSAGVARVEVTPLSARQWVGIAPDQGHQPAYKIRYTPPFWS